MLEDRFFEGGILITGIFGYGRPALEIDFRLSNGVVAGTITMNERRGK
jgi:hypothetical protein